MNGLERFIGVVLDGKYHLERLLGQGGMGAVYLALHLGTERPVALKLIAPQFMRNDEFVERFKREARAAGRLRHPNVVDVTDFGFAQVGDERVAYLVMEYLDGCSLGDVLAEESRLPLDWVVDILEQVCSAVDDAHRQGIVHRDLKPDNIWLEPTRLGGYRVKVLDFGIAKLAEADAVIFDPTAGSEQPAPLLPTRSAAGVSAESQLDDVQGAIERAASSLQRSGSRNSQADDSSEAGTQLFSSEAGTKLFSPDQPDAEPATLIFAPPSGARSQNESAATAAAPAAALDEEEGAPTLLIEHTTAQPKPGTLRTAPVADVTRVGAILGTPLYMSPEQCRGARLDARSDIYSLGVIVYQMLTGRTPFAGDMSTVLRQHMEQQPPPIKEQNKKVKKKVERVVMSALAKNPAERPASALGFSTALRGNSEGIGTLLRHAFALYSEYFPKFLRVSFLAHLPMLALAFLYIGYDVLHKQGAFSNTVVYILSSCLALLSVVISFLTSSVITALTVVIVTHLHVAPMRPIKLRDSFAVLKKRWKPFLRTSIRVSLTMLLGFILLIIPGIIVMVRYALYAPVILMEGLEKRAALKRANELSRRSRRTVIGLLLINFLVPIVINASIMLVLTAGIIVAAIKSPQVAIGIKRFSESISHFTFVFNIFVVPLISIMTALLYLKMRQIGGETFKETLEQFEDIEAPRTQWQQRMRQRLTLQTTHGQSSTGGGN